MKVRDIIFLEKDKNKKGDLFNRMVYDVFHSLGFGEPHYDVQKAGREIDMFLLHRTEKRVAIVESKAWQQKVGGSEINKFVGAFGVEKGRFNQEGYETVGYFVSHLGFTKTALEQEKERIGKEKPILLGPDEIIKELIEGNVLCSLEKAVDAVRQAKNSPLQLCDVVDLIASEEGWIWVLYYSDFPKQTTTHFAFVHADGNRLVNSVAKKLIEQARKQNIGFASLNYMNAKSKTDADKQLAQDLYFRYLETELGEIQFEGMPTDKEAGAVKVNLENIFVPLTFCCKQDEEEEHVLIEHVLTNSMRAAILAKPGGGKSTLIRRIALAYALPERRLKVDDNLPDKDWFPVYIRCRDLGDNVTKSILEIIGSIARRAEILQYESSFQAIVEDALQEGRMLLLLDGLDEISQEKNRICLVNQLRTFVATYPNAHLIVTSREAGFRAVASTLASYCQQYTIDGMDEEEIRLLCLKWHQAILGEMESTRAEADRVCNIILADVRIHALAQNPLLLTTLLFVKRWVGYLPTKKCQLYEEMIKLLLVTWNAAGHDRLEMDETEPQLAFVAYEMTKKGVQKIIKDELQKSIVKARKELPELLGYTTVTPARFIDQVEERSSLLIQTGLEENENGQLVPTYEFSHLSFQEYLTAKAVAELWIQEDDGSNAVEILISHINNEQWREIIPMAAVLLGRQARPLMECLIERSTKIPSKKEDRRANLAPLCLANCVANEVPMNQELLEQAIALLIKNRRVIDSIKYQTNIWDNINVYDTIIKSKYGNSYGEIAEKKLFMELEEEYIYEFCEAWLDNCYKKHPNEYELTEILTYVCSEDYQNQITGALLLMMTVYHRQMRFKYKEGDADQGTVGEIYKHILRLLQTDSSLSIFSASWCLVWSGYDSVDLIPREIAAKIFIRLVELWVNRDMSHDVKRVVSWGIVSVCMPSFQGKILQSIGGLEEMIEKHYQHPENEYDEWAAIYLAILCQLWSKSEIQRKMKERKKGHTFLKKKFLRQKGFLLQGRRGQDINE